MKSYLNYQLAAWLAAAVFPVLAANAAPPAAPAKQETPQSVFIMPTSPEEGRDPFFPNCNDIYKEMIVPGTTTTDNTALTSLKVNGLTHSGTNLFALINNRSFSVGEEGEVRTPQGRMRLRCVAIDMKAQSVIVQVASGQRATLFLPGGK